MKDHPHRLNRHPAVKSILLLASVLISLPDNTVHAEPQPGSSFEVKVATPDGPLTVRFRYCPTGQLVRGKPQPLPKPTGAPLIDQMKRKAILADMKGFYVTETEVSQGQFRFVLGRPAMEVVFQRLLAKGGDGEDFPVRGVDLFEAAEFCDALRKLDQRNQAATTGLEDRVFRLPTHDEWQYACRAIRDPEEALKLGHFNSWPELNHVSENTVADCTDAWRKLGEAGKFLGTQDQVVRAISAIPSTSHRIKVLDEFLRLGLGTQRSFAAEGLQTQPRVVATGKPNAWNVFNMHDNVREWSIAERNVGHLGDIWRLLVASDRQALVADDKAKFFLAGGSYNASMNKEVSNWPTFSIWGGYPMKENEKEYEPDPHSIDKMDGNNFLQSFLPGIRVVLERVLADDWVFVIRQATVLDDKVPMNGIVNKLAGYRSSVSELATGTTLTQVQARIRYYEALANYQRGNTDAGARILADSAPALPAEDSYMSLLRYLVHADTK